MANLRDYINSETQRLSGSSASSNPSSSATTQSSQTTQNTSSSQQASTGGNSLRDFISSETQRLNGTTPTTQTGSGANTTQSGTKNGATGGTKNTAKNGTNSSTQNYADVLYNYSKFKDATSNNKGRGGRTSSARQDWLYQQAQSKAATDTDQQRQNTVNEIVQDYTDYSNGTGEDYNNYDNYLRKTYATDLYNYYKWRGQTGKDTTYGNNSDAYYRNKANYYAKTASWEDMQKMWDEMGKAYSAWSANPSYAKSDYDLEQGYRDAKKAYEDAQENERELEAKIRNAASDAIADKYAEQYAAAKKSTAAAKSAYEAAEKALSYRGVETPDTSTWGTIKNAFTARGNTTEGFTKDEAERYNALLARLEEVSGTPHGTKSENVANENERQQILAQLHQMDADAGRAPRAYDAYERVNGFISTSANNIGKTFSNLVGWWNEGVSSMQTDTYGLVSLYSGIVDNYEKDYNNAKAAYELSPTAGNKAKLDVEKAKLDANQGYKNAKDALAAAQSTQQEKAQDEKTAAKVQTLSDRAAEWYGKADEYREKANEAKSALMYGKSDVGQFFTEAGLTGVEMLSDMAVGSVTGSPGMGLVNMGVRVFSNTAQESRLEGDDYSTQMQKGVAAALIEVFTEKMFGPAERLYGKAMLSPVINKFVKSKALWVLINSAGEGTEEFVADFLNLAVDHLAGWTDGTTTFGQDWKAQEDQRIYETLLGSVLGFAGSIGHVAADALSSENTNTNSRGKLTPENAAERLTVNLLAEVNENGISKETAERILKSPTMLAAFERMTGAQIDGKSTTTQIAQMNRALGFTKVKVNGEWVWTKNAEIIESADEVDKTAGKREGKKRSRRKATTEETEQDSTVTEEAEETDEQGKKQRRKRSRKKATTEEQKTDADHLYDAANAGANADNVDTSETEGTPKRANTGEVDKTAGQSENADNQNVDAPTTDAEETALKTRHQQAQDEVSRLKKLIAKNKYGDMDGGIEYVEQLEKLLADAENDLAQVEGEYKSRYGEAALSALRGETSGQENVNAPTNAEQGTQSEQGETAPAKSENVNQGNSDVLNVQENGENVTEGTAQGAAQSATEGATVNGADVTENGTAENSEAEQKSNVPTQPTQSAESTPGVNESENAEQGEPANAGAKTQAESQNPPNILVDNDEGGEGKLSKFWSNTLAKLEGVRPTPEGANPPLYYLPKSEARSLGEAASALEADKQGTIEELVSAEAWTGTQTDEAWIIENELYKQAQVNGGWSAYTAWLAVERAHLTETGRGIQALAKRTRRDGQNAVAEAAETLDADKSMTPEKKAEVMAKVGERAAQFDEALAQIEKDKAAAKKKAKEDDTDDVTDEADKAPTVDKTDYTKPPKTWEDFLARNQNAIRMGIMTEEELRESWEERQKKAESKSKKSKDAAESARPKTGVDYLTDTASDTAPSETSTHENKGGQVSFEDVEHDGIKYKAAEKGQVSKAEMHVLKRIAKATGIDFVLYQTEAVDGEYIGANGFFKNGVIYLDVHAGANTTTEQAAIMLTAAHELTHYMRAHNEAGYQALCDYVADALRANGQNVKSLMQSKIANSENLTPDEAIEELVADGCETMLKSSRIARTLAQENPNLFIRIRNWINNFCEKIRVAFGGTTWADAFAGADARSEEAKALLQYAEEMQKIWDAELATAVRNAKVDYDVDTQESRNSDRTTFDDLFGEDFFDEEDSDEIVPKHNFDEIYSILDARANESESKSDANKNVDEDVDIEEQDESEATPDAKTESDTETGEDTETADEVEDTEESADEESAEDETDVDDETDKDDSADVDEDENIDDSNFDDVFGEDEESENSEDETEDEEDTEDEDEEEEQPSTGRDALIVLIQDMATERRVGTLDKELFGKLLEKQSTEYLQEYAYRMLTQMANDNIKVSFGDKLKSLQTLMQLSNITTFEHNIFGNLSFGAVDSMAQNGVGIALDALMSKVTGKRTVSLNFGWFTNTGRKGSIDALQKSILEVAGDVDMGGGNRYSERNGRTFKASSNFVERALSRWEQLLNYSLRTSDKVSRGQIENVYYDALSKIKDSGLTEDEMHALATEMADYLLFQNKGRAYNISKGIHDYANTIIGFGGKINAKGVREGGFGIGDTFNPYPGVPANLGMKPLEYSPLNVVKGGIEVVQTIKAAKEGTLDVKQQQQAAMDVARGMTGTALIVLFGMLARSGWIKDWDEEEDADVKAQNAAEGKTGIQINLDGALRWLRGKDTAGDWVDGDTAVDVGWLEPVNSFLAIGCLIAAEETEDVSAWDLVKNYSSDFAIGSAQAFMDIPVVSGLSDLWDTYQYSDATTIGGQAAELALTAGSNMLTSFSLGPARALAKGLDPYYRDTTGDNLWETTINKLKLNTPFLRETLPMKYDSLGNPKTYGGSLGERLINALVAPGTVTHIHQSDASEFLADLREKSGDTSIYPSRKAPKSITIGEEKIKLTTDQKRQWQQTAGELSTEYINELYQSGAFDDLTTEQQVEVVKACNQLAQDYAKEEFVKGLGNDYSSDLDKVRDLSAPVTYLTAKQALSDAANAKDGEEVNYDAVDALIDNFTSMPEDVQETLTNDGYNIKRLRYADALGVDSEEYYRLKEAVAADTAKMGVKTNLAIAISVYNNMQGATNEELLNAMDLMLQDEPGNHALIVRQTEAYINYVKEQGGTPDVGAFLTLINKMNTLGYGTTLSSKEKRALWPALGARDNNTKLAGLTRNQFYALMKAIDYNTIITNPRYARQENEEYNALYPKQEKTIVPLDEYLDADLYGGTSSTAQNSSQSAWGYQDALAALLGY